MVSLLAQNWEFLLEERKVCQWALHWEKMWGQNWENQLGES